jgi:hypothetical protein
VHEGGLTKATVIWHRAHPFGAVGVDEEAVLIDGPLEGTKLQVEPSKFGHQHG